MYFPLRTAREYPIFGSHFDPDPVVCRPAREVIFNSILIPISIIVLISVLYYRDMFTFGAEKNFYHGFHRWTRIGIQFSYP